MDRTPDNLDDANTRYFDSALRHQIGVGRFSSGEVKRLLAIVEKSDAEVVKILRKRLKRMTGKPIDITSKRFKAMLIELKTLRRALKKELSTELISSLKQFSKQEAAFEQKMINAALTVEIDTVAVGAATLKGIVTTRPFAGGANAARTLTQWFDTLSRTDQTRLTESIQLGLLQGETTDQITRRVVGTRAKKYADGVLAINRRNAEAVVRTAVNHVSNASREMFWEENEGLFEYLKWTATLDGRTSAICRGRDGALVLQGGAALPEGGRLLEPQSARPPAHPNCLPGDSFVSPCGFISGASKRWYQGKLTTIKTASGHEFSCTPNHPILTDKGWVAAGLLNKGSYVVSYNGGKKPFFIGKNKHKHTMFSLKDVFCSFGEKGKEFFGKTNTTDFHGDGIDGEIYVIRTDCLLSFIEKHAPSFHHLFELFFKLAVKPTMLFFSFCGHTLFFKAARSSLSRFMRGLSLVYSSLFGSVSPNPEVRLTGFFSFLRLIPPYPRRLFSVTKNTFFAQKAINWYYRKPRDLRYLIWRITGKIKLDNVLWVGEKEFSDYVYNLQTSSGYYTVGEGNIIVHNCRSLMVAILSADGVAQHIGDRPFVTDTRTRRKRQIDFRAQAKEASGKDGWKALSVKQRNANTRDIRRAWAAENIGTIPSDVSYNQWLDRQSTNFQNGVLGKTKGKLFRSGKLTLDKFTDRAGKEYTLEQLAATHPEVFESAGIDLSNFT